MSAVSLTITGPEQLMRPIKLIGMITLAGIAGMASATQTGALQTHQSIQTAAEEFISAEVAASHGVVPVARAGRLDTRLRLAECDAPLESFLPAGGRTLGNTTVGVRCNGSQTWTLYVPVRVSVYETIVTAARPLSRGTVLQARDLTLVEKDLAQLRSGYFTNREELIGKQVTRPVLIGAAFTTQTVKNAQQIKRGDRIGLIATTGGLQVRMSGEALENGAMGEKIRVRNLSSKRVVEGIILSRATVQVDL
jgi:flagella basal body P-ring formation protein FlgA